MATCLTPGCGKPALEGADKCFKHGGRATKSTVSYGFCLVPTGGATTPNTTFASRAGEANYQKAIQNFLSKGPDGASRAYSVHSVMLSHDTNGKGKTMASVFFKWAGNMMHVYALGYHVGNDIKDYEFMWHDGTSKKWSRPA